MQPGQSATPCGPGAHRRRPRTLLRSPSRHLAGRPNTARSGVTRVVTKRHSSETTRGECRSSSDPGVSVLSIWPRLGPVPYARTPRSSAHGLRPGWRWVGPAPRADPRSGALLVCRQGSHQTETALPPKAAAPTARRRELPSDTRSGPGLSHDPSQSGGTVSDGMAERTLLSISARFTYHRGGARAPPPNRAGSGRNLPARSKAGAAAVGAGWDARADQRQPGTNRMLRLTQWPTESPRSVRDRGFSMRSMPTEHNEV